MPVVYKAWLLIKWISKYNSKTVLCCNWTVCDCNDAATLSSQPCNFSMHRPRNGQLVFVRNEMTIRFDSDGDDLKMTLTEGAWSEVVRGLGQFLKAPQRLARHMKSLSRLPSICQKAGVWVTSVRWFTQNLKQNSSRSWMTKHNLVNGSSLGQMLFKKL